MKKVISLMICFLFVGFLDACSHKESVPSYNNDSTLVDKSYVIDNKILEQEEKKVTWNLEYPVLNNESNYYSEVNNILINEILELTTHNDVNLEGHYYYTGTYEITEQTEKIVSLCYVVSMFYEHAAHPTEYCYGLTIDIQTGEMVTLSAYACDVDSIFGEIENGNYSVAYGAFSLMSEEEVADEIRKNFSECNPNSSFNNYYIDGGKVCLIVNGVIGSDYSVVTLS